MITYVSNSALANSTFANSALVIKSDDKIIVGKEKIERSVNPSLPMLLPTELLELWQ